jgi:hypothetical protein
MFPGSENLRAQEPARILRSAKPPVNQGIRPGAFLVRRQRPALRICRIRLDPSRNGADNSVSARQRRASIQDYPDRQERIPLQNQKASRPAARLPHLENRLNAYALSAAAGIGLALIPRAEAKIIYTPENKVLNSGELLLPIDDAARFAFFNGLESKFLSFKVLSVRPLSGAAVMVGGGYAQALASGASIGPSGVFQTQKARMEWVEFLSDSSLTQAYGPWANVSNRYVGLSFVINGQTHYGWARFSVSNSGSLTGGVKIKATFTGFAVETVANRAIQAGQTSGTEENASLGSLGCLAAGCTGIPVWRP